MSLLRLCPILEVPQKQYDQGNREIISCDDFESAW